MLCRVERDREIEMSRQDPPFDIKRISDLDVEADSWIFLPETGDHLRQKRGAVGMDDADAERPRHAAFEFGDRNPGCFRLYHEALSMLAQCAPGFGQLHPLRRTVEQYRPQILLERANLLGKRGLGHAKCIRGLGHPAVCGN